MQIDRPTEGMRSGITPNGPRIREAIVHLIREADRHRKNLSQFDILKALFLADKEHLNVYGRPITFDEYSAMKDGPVASVSYNVLKGEKAALELAQITEPLWSMRPGGEKKNLYYNATRNASDDILSESDMSVLRAKMLLVKEWGYNRTWQYVHEDVAYKEAWQKNGSANHWMDYALLLEKPDDEYIRDLKFFAGRI